MLNKSSNFQSLFHFLLLSLCISLHGEAFNKNVGELVKRGERKLLVETEYGSVHSVEISNGTSGQLHLQFITLEPNSTFLPVHLHANMILYVHTGNGTLVWANKDDIVRVDLRRGDVYRLQAGFIFYLQSKSNLDTEQEKLRVHAVFTNTEEGLYEPRIEAYLSISELFRGFSNKVLQSAFKVPEEVAEAMTHAAKPPAIIRVTPESSTFDWEDRLLKALLGERSTFGSSSRKKGKKAFNMYDADKDVENCHGWSRTVTRRDSYTLKGSEFAILLVNLNANSMLGPHWNPKAMEALIVLEGRGMVRVLCASGANQSDCLNSRFYVEKGDVFSVPMFHPAAQMSFSDASLVFLGFSTTGKRFSHQCLAGKNSILQTLDKDILAISFNVSNTTIDELFVARDSIITGCISCAEEEARIMEEETAKERHEEGEGRGREKEEKWSVEEEEYDETERSEESERDREFEETRGTETWNDNRNTS